MSAHTNRIFILELNTELIRAKTILRMDSLLWKTCLFWNCRPFSSPTRQGKKSGNFKISMRFTETNPFLHCLSSKKNRNIEIFYQFKCKISVFHFLPFASNYIEYNSFFCQIASKSTCFLFSGIRLTEKK